MTTQLLVTSVLPFVATKPDSDTQQFIVVNQNDLEIYGQIWVEAEANVTWQLVVGAETTQNQPMNYTLASNNLFSVEATMLSVGLSADVHDIVIRVNAKTTESLRVDREMSSTFTVTSYAVANNSRAELVGDPPMMGLQVWGDKQVQIRPYDDDNQRIMSTNAGFDFFTVGLYTKHGEQTSTVMCDVDSTPVSDPDFRYYAKCSIPDLTTTEGAAGAWDVVAQLDGETILQAPVDMWCPEDYYRDEGSCYECGVGDTIGAICSVEWDDHSVPSGTTLEAVILKKHYWRAHERSAVIYPCAIKAACKGGDGGGQSPPEYCNEVIALCRLPLPRMWRSEKGALHRDTLDRRAERARPVGSCEPVAANHSQKRGLIRVRALCAQGSCSKSVPGVQ